MASSSGSNSNLVGQWTYDVFLSFAGKDTREGFVGHLYRALDDRGIYTFKDNHKLHMGDSISDVLLNSIEASRVAVVVFSEKYAASSWCLDELVKIMECHKRIGQTVIPVFYHVDPFIIRRQMGIFEESFRKHEIRFQNDLEKVQMWREALAEAAGLSGIDVSKTADGNEAECIIKIVQEISSKCKTSASVAKNLVGIESRVQEVKSLLCTSPDDVRFLGICGVGGVGKTTLAWAVYNQVSNNFQGRSYVANVREVAKHSGLPILQQKVLSEILLDASIKVNSDREGIELMGKRLKRKSVFLVLDDVDDLDQLDALAGSHDWFGKGSRIVITTRDEHLLNRSKVSDKYNATLLNHVEAMQLFSLYAFGKSEPPEEYDEYSHGVVRYASGLPLALKVLGSFLYQRGIDEWRSALNRLKVAPHDKIFEILKTSFDSLSTIEQNIFLDIACFFKGKKKDQVVRILDSFDFCGDIGISVLVQKSLIWVSNKRLHMHDLIQEMGWHIVRKVSDEPGRRSRLWLPADVSHVFTNYSGTNAIQGISLEPTLELDRVISFTKCFRSMNELRLLQLHRGCVSKTSLSRYLWIKLTSTAQLEYLPNNLRWLTWLEYPFVSLPETFESENLVGLELLNSDLVQLWKGRKRMDMLRLISLHGSRNLKSTPDFKWTPNLRILNLDHCLNLVKLHPSLADLEQLVFLSLRYCKKLESFPSPIRLRSLETLNLTNCSKLKKFPQVSGNMNKLLKLQLRRSSFAELPSSIGNLCSLVLIDLKGSKNLKSLPSTICSLKSLKTLNVSDCFSFEKLPENLGHIESLKELFLELTRIEELPSSILSKNLETLSIVSCPKLAGSLLKYKNSSFGLELPPLLNVRSIRRLFLGSCSLSDGDIPDLSSLFSLEELDLSGNYFQHLHSSICQLPRLKILDVCRCVFLEELQALPLSVAVLHASWSDATKSIPDLLAKYESLCKVRLDHKATGFDGEFPKLVMQSLLQGCLIRNHRFGIYFPGNRIPQWLSNRYQGNETYLWLSSNWFNKSLLGFAISAVFVHYEWVNPTASIQFDLIKEEMSNMVATSDSQDCPLVEDDFGHYLWLGFFSVPIFRLLFPDFKADDWSNFKGCVRARFWSDEIFEAKQCAIRLVYEEDVKQQRVPGIQNSVVLDDPTGRPWFLHDDEDDRNEEEGDADQVDVDGISSNTVFLKEKGYGRAKILFHL